VEILLLVVGLMLAAVVLVGVGDPACPTRSTSNPT
jgi:hypothetical protein